MRWCGCSIARLTLLLVLLLVGWTAPVYAGPTSSPSDPEETVLIVEVGSGAVVVVRATSSRSAWSIQYAYAAVDPFTGTMTSLIHPDVNAHAMSSFLNQVAKEYPHEHILMIMDGAGWHRAAELKIPHHITIVHLPPYSPELNPAEHLWDELREKNFCNRVFDDLDAVFQHLIKAVRLLHDDPQRIASLTGFDWFIRGR